MRDEAPSGDETPSVSEVASAYVDGEVGADQAAWIEANRGTDAGVDSEVEGFAQVKDLLGGLDLAVPGEGGWGEIGDAVRRGAAREARRSWAARASAVAAAIVLVAAVALGAVVLAGRSGPDPARQATPAGLASRSTESGLARPATGAVAGARGIGSVVERAGVAPRPNRTTTTSTSTRPPVSTLTPPR